MSTITDIDDAELASLMNPASSEEEILDQLRELAEPHTSSAQAHDDVGGPRHNDGERLYKEFRVQPFHKYMARGERHGKNVALFPSAWLAPMLHLEEREKEVLEHIAGEVDYDHQDASVSHPVLEEVADDLPLRAKMLEWVAADGGDRLPMNASGRRTIDCFTAGGTDMNIYGGPGSGKTTLELFAAMTRMQLNNEAILWADTLDSSLQNERTEWLPFAGFATICVPAHVDVSVRLVPADPTVGDIEVELEELCREVIRYESPRDLASQLTRGAFHVVYPDPTFQGCDDVSDFPFHGPTDTTAPGEDGPTARTPPDHWWFAMFSALVTHDLFNGWVSLIIDEAGNLLDPDASKDVHKTYEKIVFWMKKYADARKKGVSIDTMCHGIAERHQKIRSKERRWLTMNGASPPIGTTMPGDKSCPIAFDYASDMDAGEGQVWTTSNYASVNWPNLKRDARLDAEVSIEMDLPGGVA